MQPGSIDKKDPNEKVSPGGLVLLILIPGPNPRFIQIAPNTTVAKFVKNQNLSNHHIIINGMGIHPSEYSKIKIEGGGPRPGWHDQIFAICSKENRKPFCSKDCCE